MPARNTPSLGDLAVEDLAVGAARTLGVRRIIGCTVALAVASFGCSANTSDSTATTTSTSDGGGSDLHGTITALTYNVAGLPEGLSGSHPEANMPQIGPKLNDFDLVLVQESWLTPDPNPTPFRTYHEILEETSTLDYSSTPLPAPLGKDPDRSSAQLSDGLNQFSRFEFEPALDHVRWPDCGQDAADCLATKGFTLSVVSLASGVDIDVYNLHMEAGNEDFALRETDVALLGDYISQHSADRAVIVGGDFNLHIEDEPDGTQFSSLLEAADLEDACETLGCPEPHRIDKFLYRSSADLTITPTSWSIAEGFVDAEGKPLSDHEPVVVDFEWTAKNA
jgi:endonuclease/exonuclease/phosphatase family metal-dependent hydrolase